MATRSFKELIVWQKAHSFVLNVYKFAQSFSKDEMYGLTSQFKRAAVSIAGNIAEGYAKKSLADKLKFFNISQGSLEECEYYIVLSRDLEFISKEQEKVLDSLSDEIGKLLQSYMKKMQSSKNS